MFSLLTRSWFHVVTSSKARKERSREETLGEGVWRLFGGKKKNLKLWSFYILKVQKIQARKSKLKRIIKKINLEMNLRFFFQNQRWC